MKKRLRKSHRDKKLDGVLGGIGEWLGVDPVIIRVIFILLCFGGFGTPIIAYIALSIVMPSDDGRQSSHRDTDTYTRYTYNRRRTTRPRKEAKPVSTDDTEDWSDF